MKKIIPVGIGVVLLSTSLCGVKYINKITEENKKLKQEQSIRDSIEVGSNIEKVKEINKDNCKLIIYESSKGVYSKTVTDGKLIPVNSSVETTYSYDVTYDLTTANIMEINDITYIEIDYSNIKLNKIEIDQPEITNNLNILSQLKGKSISELNSELVIICYEDIEKIVHNSFNDNMDTFKMNLQSKLNNLYEGLNVVVTYKGDNK